MSASVLDIPFPRLLALLVDRMVKAGELQPIYTSSRGYMVALGPDTFADALSGIKVACDRDGNTVLLHIGKGD